MPEEKNKNRILIVEDSIFNQKILENILMDSYILETAASAREVFSIVETFDPHLILLDIILPDANGFDVLRSLGECERTKHIPVIIISGLDREKDEEKGFLLGAVDYIKKPFKKAIVKARISTQIQIINQMRAIEEMSLLDGLTGIFNRRAFDRKLRAEWDSAHEKAAPLSMLMIDVDMFKCYNDTYGHPQGDMMLQAVAITIKSMLRPGTGILCRYGGEEFAVILPETDLSEAVITAEKIRLSIKALHLPSPDSGTATKATISIGAASLYPGDSGNPKELIEAADNMLYRAKEMGRNQVQYEGK
ncbi:MAG: diguanylate cyclase [Lacrimispora sp.]|uniref:diguanylate cyclase n=1 Tax=Lacrimispora sp. TaxID=2719234 RepID=UPI0039E5A7E8